MSLSRCAALALVSLLAAGSTARAGDSCVSSGSPEGYVCRQVVVEYDPASFDWTVTPARLGLKLEGIIPRMGEPEALFTAPEGAVMDDLIGALMNENGVIEAEANEEFVSPECRQWGATVIELGPDWLRLVRDQPALATMRVDPDSSAVALPGQGVTVAVVDTGVSRSHPLVSGRLAGRGIDMVSGSALADDLGNGIDDDNDGVTDRGWGHGTAVAGLVALVAPGARILSVRVLDDECRGNSFQMAMGIVRAVDAGARVVNASFGSIDDNRVIKRAVQYAGDRGVAVIAPAGNDGRDRLQFPAERSDAIAVAAVDDRLVAPAFTAHSSSVALSAPGVDVLVPYRASYALVSGTSFSTALVSGAFAVGFGYAPGLSERGVLDVLQDTAIPVDPANPDLDGELGDGVPDLGRSIASFRAWRRTTETRDRAGTAGSAMPVQRTGTILTGGD